MQEVNETEASLVPHRSWLARAYLWACERLYDELAWRYDAVSWLVSAGQWRKWQAGVWSQIRGRRVLELGCGTGHVLAAGEARRMEMVGLDLSPKMLAVAHGQRHGTLVEGDGRTLPFADEVFDSVIATFPAGYVLEPVTLQEIRRVLRPSGRVVLLGLWVELAIPWLARLLPVFYGRPRAEKLEQVRTRVEAAGFHAWWVEQSDAPFTVGLLVAERKASGGDGEPHESSNIGPE